MSDHSDIPGFTSFKGVIAHTARWPRELKIKETDRVGVIGTGSSGLQVAGAIAPQVPKGHLTIFQRTPSYILPEQAPLSFTPEQKKMLLDRKYFWKYTLEGWEGGERFFTVYFPGSRNQIQVLDRARKFMQKEIKDPVLLKKMLPDYPIGCRRLTFTRPFLNAIHMKHVFVNVDTIVRVDEKGVVTKSKETGEETHTPLDILVAATGFGGSISLICGQGNCRFGLTKPHRHHLHHPSHEDHRSQRQRPLGDFHPLAQGLQECHRPRVPELQLHDGTGGAVGSQQVRLIRNFGLWTRDFRLTSFPSP